MTEKQLERLEKRLEKVAELQQLIAECIAMAKASDSVKVKTDLYELAAGYSESVSERLHHISRIVE